MCRYVNDALYEPPAPGYLDIVSVAAQVVGSELRVHITTRESIPPQAPGVYVFECYFDAPLGSSGSRILVAALGQSEPKYGCSPPLPAVAGAVVDDTHPTYARLSSAGLTVAYNVLTLTTNQTSLLQPEYLTYVAARYYDPPEDAYGEAVDVVVVSPMNGGSVLFGIGPDFVGASPAIEGLMRDGPSPARPPQVRNWFGPKDPRGRWWQCPPNEHQLPLLPTLRTATGTLTTMERTTGTTVQALPEEAANSGVGMTRLAATTALWL